MKVCVGAGPVNLGWHVYFNHYKDAKELGYALVPIFNAEMKELVEAGATFLQIEDLGAWLPLFTGDDGDYEWIGDVIAQSVDGVDAKIAWHFCFGNAWGNRLAGLFEKGYETVLPHFYDVPVDQFVLDYANREMTDIDALKSLPDDKEVGVGVVDIRTTMIETPEEIADRIRKVISRRPARARLPDHGLRHEAAAADGGQDEAARARRGRADRARRAQRLSRRASAGRRRRRRQRPAALSGRRSAPW